VSSIDCSEVASLSSSDSDVCRELIADFKLRFSSHRLCSCSFNFSIAFCPKFNVVKDWLKKLCLEPCLDEEIHAFFGRHLGPLVKSKSIFWDVRANLTHILYSNMMNYRIWRNLK
jgi:hypothetical protein